MINFKKLFGIRSGKPRTKDKKKMEDQEPGTFQEAESVEEDQYVKKGQEIVKPKPEQHPDLVTKYNLFSEHFGFIPKSVYYPCGANDISPSKSFPNAKIIYADLDDNAMKSLREEGYEAITTDVLKFNPGNIDLVILLNPQIKPDYPIQFVNKGSYVLSNDYHQTATEIKANPDFELKGIIRKGKDGKFFVDTESLDDYWKEIDNEEDFKNAPINYFAYGVANYTTAQKYVKRFFSEETNVFEGYKRLIEMAKKENPDSDSDTLTIKSQGSPVIISTRFPNKKATVDDIFVFQRKKTFEDIKRENTVETGSVIIEGKNYTYRVCKQEMQPDLPNFVGFNGTEFFISDSVPPKYRNYIFVHEATCIPKMGQPNHCVNAVEHELADIPLPDRLDYIIFRRNFFQGLIEFFNKRATDKNAQFRAELQKSLNFLNKQLTK